MSDNSEEKNPKLESYIAYGMIFGLLAGSIFSTFGIIAGNVFLAVGSCGVGITLGMLTGTLLYSIKKERS
ncbi:hypothetical protein [Niallia sp.]|uniref:hypothetical protein n=1 Tax=Niallia sp. TaxID=2837523 RepID=UPI0028A08E42|nr:hypothetical protein [Niallia sp.]